jgi:hypothetical protein
MGGTFSPYHLWDGLKTILMDDASVKLGFPEQIRKNQFDIVQHLGLLYHVRDPLIDILAGEKRHQNGRIFAAGNGRDPQQRGVVHAV